MPKRWCLWGVLFSLGVLALAAGAPVFGTESPALKRSYLGECLPELSTDGARWINAPDGLRLAEHRGAPTLLLFTVLW